MNYPTATSFVGEYDKQVKILTSNHTAAFYQIKINPGNYLWSSLHRLRVSISYLAHPPFSAGAHGGATFPYWYDGFYAFFHSEKGTKVGALVLPTLLIRIVLGVDHTVASLLGWAGWKLFEAPTIMLPSILLCVQSNPAALPTFWALRRPLTDAGQPRNFSLALFSCWEVHN